MRLRDATPADAHTIARIYNHYIRSTVITFELVEIGSAEVASRINKVTVAGLPWIVAEEGGGVVGWAYAGPFRERAAFAHSVEISVYLDRDVMGKGIGTALFEELFSRLRGLTRAQSNHAPIRVVVGGVALPNDASVALHERFGMRKVALFEEVGFKLGRWVDVGYWEINLSDEAAKEEA